MISLLQRLREHALRAPASVALDGTRPVSYEQLWRRASAIAERVDADGGAPGAPIGVTAGRSADAVAAVVGVLLAGRPYVPLDLELPAARLVAILDDVQPSLILADSDHADSGLPDSDHAGVAGGNRGRVVIDEIDGNGADREAPELGPDDLAYIMFTSGSTGTPKGVAMRHGALANLMEWQLGDRRLGAPARTLQLTPLTFDVSFQEIFGCLCHGGTLWVVEESLRQDSARLAQLLVDERIERLYLPFVGLQQLAEAAAGTGRYPTAMRDIITAGEQLQTTPAIVDFFARLPECRLHNHYGPCETHVVTVHTLDGPPGEWPPLPPIGSAVPNVDIRILDEALNEVAIGDTGEIFLGGACVAEGYWNRPDLTGERFVDDPFRAQAGARLYRTGDLGRDNGRGEFEWIGRNDHQVKVRGYRVELGEVETTLAQHPSVRQAVVVPRKRKATTELIAYLLATDDEPGDSPDALESVDEWRQVWERTYDGESPDDPALHTVGWNSSYTAEPFSAEEMQEWVDGTVARVGALGLGNVLEIGCGTGMLLFRLAPQATSYVGLDFSPRATDYVRRQVESSHELAGRVEVLEAAAHDLDVLGDRTFDLIVMNSVSQHFPSAHYLMDVLERAAERLSPGGAMFVGDVSSRTHRRAFHTEIEHARASASTTAGRLRELALHRSELDTELTIEPAFFAAMPQVLPAFDACELQVRRGEHRNEMTKFRYDALLRKSASPLAASEVVPWGEVPEAQRTVDGIMDLVASGTCVQGIPDARLVDTYDLVDRLAAAEPEAILSAAGDAAGSGAFDPEHFYAAAGANAADGKLEIEARPSALPACFDIARAGSHPAVATDISSRAQAAALTSDPQRRKRAERVVPEVRSFVAAALPDYMQPAQWVLVDSFPETRSGKVDRRALPPPSRERPALATSYAPPATEVQRKIEAVWRDLLQLSRVGIDDAFYELGGNSLLILDLSLRLGKVLEREVTAVDILAHPTIRSLSARLEGTTKDQVPDAQERGLKQKRALGARRPRPVRRPRTT